MIRVYPDLEALSRGAAELFAAEAVRAVGTAGRFAVLLAGGETPRRCYEILAGPPFRDRIPWHGVHVFWGDERCVPGDDPRNNSRMARLALLDRVPVPVGQIHPISCDGAPREGAEGYERLLRAFFGNAPPRFDLAFLGLGANGHTASLFPGSPVLDEGERWAAEVEEADLSPPRVTLTAPVINRAGVVAFLVAGAEKAAVLKEVLEGDPDPRRLPARLIRPSEGELLWLVDREAARLLSMVSEGEN